MKRLKLQINRILNEEWDPIDMREHPETHDEYEIYADRILAALNSGAAETEIASRLLDFERHDMELKGNEERAARVAHLVVQEFKAK